MPYKDKEKERKYIKKYKEENKERLKKYNKEYNNKPEVKARKKKWDIEHKDDPKRKEYKKKWRKENPNYMKKWISKNRKRYLEINRIKAKRHEHKNPEKIKARRIAKNLKLKGNKCEKCGRKEKLEGHHPNYSLPNKIITLCVKCHREVHSNS